MYIALTTRKIKPGEWEAFREAWAPEDAEFPPGFIRAIHARNLGDPDEVVSFGMVDASREDIERWASENADNERRRQEAMASHVEATGTDAIFEVIEEVEP